MLFSVSLQCYIQKGEYYEVYKWLEKANQVPNVSPDVSATLSIRFFIVWVYLVWVNLCRVIQLNIMAMQYQNMKHHDMEMWKCFLHYCPFTRAIHHWMEDSPHKGPVVWGFDIFFDLTLHKMLLVIGNALPLIWHHCNDLTIGHVTKTVMVMRLLSWCLMLNRVAATH